MTGSSILNASSLEPPSHKLRNILIGIIVVILVAIAAYYAFRFTSEKRTIERFMNAETAGNFELAYQIWKPNTSYSYQDFLEDWGMQGYYGPVESYRIRSEAEPPNGGSGVIVTVEVSPVHPFPSDKDPQSGRSREVRLWVERSDQSIGFPP